MKTNLTVDQVIAVMSTRSGDGVTVAQAHSFLNHLEMGYKFAAINSGILTPMDFNMPVGVSGASERVLAAFLIAVGKHMILNKSHFEDSVNACCWANHNAIMFAKAIGASEGVGADDFDNYISHAWNTLTPKPNRFNERKALETQVSRRY